MNIHLHNADIVMIIALALLCAEALAANAAAITAVIAFEMLLA